MYTEHTQTHTHERTEGESGTIIYRICVCVRVNMLYLSNGILSYYAGVAHKGSKSHMQTTRRVSDSIQLGCHHMNIYFLIRIEYVCVCVHKVCGVWVRVVALMNQIYILCTVGYNLGNAKCLCTRARTESSHHTTL